jgi:hypothetical protein
MAKSEQQRQKKLAKKRSKELRNQQQLARRNQAMKSVLGQMQWASRYPVHRCYVGQTIFGEQGIGSIYLTRKLNDGRLAFMFLLIDSHCLGVKDAGARFCTESQFDEFFERSVENNQLVAGEPSYAKKLTEQAIAYAASIGFSPHADYRRVSPLWGDIDAADCQVDFTFGLDGQPSYCSGPFEDEARQNFIFRRLCETVGEGNFHFTLGGPIAGPGEFPFGVDLDDSDELDAAAWDEENTEIDWLDEGRVIEGSVSQPAPKPDAPT